MKLILSNDIRVIHPCDGLKNFLIEKCTLENPEYTSASKYGNTKFSSIPKTLELYEDQESSLVIPRGCLIYINSGDENIIDMRTFYKDETKVNCKFKLRNYQKEALDQLLKHEFGIIKIPPGGGKTMVGLALACVLQQPTLFLVHTDVLFKQTIRKITNLTDVGYVGKIRGKQFLISDFITVATVQTMRNISFLRDYFSAIIVDECHHTPARTFMEVVNQFNAKYVCGLTATPIRSDGLQEVMFLNIGPIVYDVDFRYLISKGYISDPKIKVIRLQKKLRLLESKNIFTTLLQEIISDEDRNKIILEEVIKYKGKGSCLILSARVSHCELLFDLLAKHDIKTAILVGTEDPEPVLEKLECGEIRCLIATFDKLGEGLDIHNINKLILATPFKSQIMLEQAIGRVARLSGEVPEVVDLVDNHSYANYLFNLRNNLYRKYGFRVEVVRC